MIYVTVNHSKALDHDSLSISDPLLLNLNSIDEIQNIKRDVVSNGRGSSLFCMIEKFLGQTIFRNGIRNFIRKYQYSNVKPTDLWSELSNVSGFDVNKIMENFIKFKGFPLVSVEKLSEGRVRISQKPFCNRKCLEPKSKTIWNIPIKAQNGDKFILTENEVIVNSPINFVINSDAIGYYRTNFARSIINEIDLSSLPFLNQSSILEDTFAKDFSK